MQSFITGQKSDRDKKKVTGKSPMRQNIKNNNTGVKRVFERLAEEKKKSVTALCLIAVMAFMWIRVFTKKTPQGAEAAPVTEQSSTENPPKENYSVSFVELPRVAGRNDAIVRDFFAADGWRHFVDGQRRKPDGIEEVSVVSTDGNEEVIKKVAEKKLKLGAIMLSADPLVLINDKELSMGGKVLVRDGTDMYEFELVEIEEDTVVLTCGEAEITLKLTD